MSLSEDLYQYIKSGINIDELKQAMDEANARVAQEKEEEIARTACYNERINDMCGILQSVLHFCSKHYMTAEEAKELDMSHEEMIKIAKDLVDEIDGSVPSSAPENCATKAKSSKEPVTERHFYGKAIDKNGKVYEREASGADVENVLSEWIKLIDKIL